jgi:hypothetical protein
MKQEYLAAIYNRVKINGMITPPDITLLVKDMINRLDVIEDKLDELTKVRASSSKVSKSKTTTT